MPAGAYNALGWQEDMPSNPDMTDPTPEPVAYWPVSLAARALGVTTQAIGHRARTGALRFIRNDRNELLIHAGDLLRLAEQRGDIPRRGRKPAVKPTATGAAR